MLTSHVTHQNERFMKCLYMWVICLLCMWRDEWRVLGWLLFYLDCVCFGFQIFTHGFFSLCHVWKTDLYRKTGATFPKTMHEIYLKFINGTWREDQSGQICSRMFMISQNVSAGQGLLDSDCLKSTAWLQWGEVKTVGTI